MGLFGPSLNFDQFAEYALNNLAVKGELMSVELKHLIDADFARDNNLNNYKLSRGFFFMRMESLEDEGCVTSQFRQVENEEKRKAWGGCPARCYKIADGGYRKLAVLNAKKTDLGFHAPGLPQPV